MANKQTYFVRHNGYCWFVKSYDLFEYQGGFDKKWGESWKPIEATSIEDARVKAEEKFNA